MLELVINTIGLSLSEIIACSKHGEALEEQHTALSLPNKSRDSRDDSPTRIYRPFDFTAVAIVDRGEVGVSSFFKLGPPTKANVLLVHWSIMLIWSLCACLFDSYTCTAFEGSWAT